MQNIIFGIFLIATLVVPKLVLSQIDAELKFEDSLKKQFSASWVMPAGVMLEKGMTMKVSAEYNEDGTLKPESVALLETNIPKSNPFYKPIVESTLYSMCKKIDLLPEDYNQWEKIIINFDFSKIN